MEINLTNQKMRKNQKSVVQFSECIHSLIAGQRTLQVYVTNFKSLCNSITKILNVVEDPAQHVHTIIVEQHSTNHVLFLIQVCPHK